MVISEKRGRRFCFCFVRPKKTFLELCVFLGRELNAPEVRRRTRASKYKTAHVIQIRHGDEVEALITDWIEEAYELAGAETRGCLDPDPSTVSRRSDPV